MPGQDSILIQRERDLVRLSGGGIAAAERPARAGEGARPFRKRRGHRSRQSRSVHIGVDTRRGHAVFLDRNDFIGVQLRDRQRIREDRDRQRIRHAHGLIFRLRADGLRTGHPSRHADPIAEDQRVGRVQICARA